MTGPIPCPACKHLRDESAGWYLVGNQYYCGACAPRERLLIADRYDVDLKYPRPEYC